VKSVCVIAALAAAAGAASAQSAGIRIRLTGEPPVFLLEGSGILPRLNNPNLEAALKVTLDKPGAPPLSGNYEMKSGALVFTPRYRLQPGVAYRVTYKLLNESATETFTAPTPPAVPATVVERIFPSADVLPENQLKFYIHFSSSMSKGESAKRIHLLDSANREIALPFLEIDEELWDRDQKRLTLLFDPGRVKREVLPNREVGPPLKAGGRYTLVVDKEWKDANGVPLKEGYRKSFTAGPAERSAIDPKVWQLLPPAPDSMGPLIVDFPRPLDAALLLRFIDVADARGALVRGKVTLDMQERRWLFTPEQPWNRGKYSLEILTTLEDLAGNKIGRPFDVDRFDQVQSTITSDSYSLPFQVGAAR